MAQTSGSGVNRANKGSRSVNDVASQKRNTAVRAPSSGRSPNYGYLGFSASPKSAVPSALTKGSGGRGTNYGGGGGRSYSGGGGGYGGGGGFVGSTSGGSISRTVAPAGPPPRPAAPDLASYLAKDTTYQDQLSQLKKAYADYMAQQNNAKTQYTTNYAGDVRTLGENRKNSLGELENDYASRGLLQSGLYADSLSDLNTDFDKRLSDIEKAKAAYLQQLANDLTNFTGEQTLTSTKAKQEAAARRAAQYGL